MYSYISIFSSPCVQQPKSLTRFVCWSSAINVISFMNSSSPCPEFLASLFTAIGCPSIKMPVKSDFQCQQSINIPNFIVFAVSVNSSSVNAYICQQMVHLPTDSYSCSVLKFGNGECF